MEHINVSRKRLFDGKIAGFSSQHHATTSVENIVGRGGFWSSEKKDSVSDEFFIIDYQHDITIDFIELTPSHNGAATFPKSFRIESSLDGKSWKTIHTERNYALEGESYFLDIPLTRLKYLKLVINEARAMESKYFAEIANCRAGILGVREIRSTSSLTGGGPDILFSTDSGSLWSSALKKESEKEEIMADLGKVFHVSRITIGSADGLFPENFNADASADGNIWVPLFEEMNFRIEPGKKYYWDLDVTPARFIRIQAKGVKSAEGLFGIHYSSIEIFAANIDTSHTHNIGTLTPYASIFQAGVMKLASDGSDAPLAAVQGNDRRLKDASPIFKGIVQFAEDKESGDNLAVQATDSRLKPATEINRGIVRLAYDRETKPGTVVQGNDSRLQEATDEKFGIVKLCPHGIYTDLGVVKGNDPRINKATTENHGICLLAEDGAATGGTVVQASDKRLRNATTMYPGIMEFAENGENAPDVAVQGNDRRLRDSTTTSKGIVELAENGEDAPNVAVQGNDRRLKDSTTTSKGIVELAENGEDAPNVAVQGNDRRLKDSTTTSKGIVELAENGENAPDVAVQGNDRRLRDATVSSKGIMKFANNGEDAPNVAVQGNDKRLKDATTSSKGIVELAENGEDAPNVAVQGNDKRLKDATTTTKGIIELAENGEDAPNVAVQGNDRRLRDATTTTKGIVELAENGEDAPNVAVQGNDKRLRDASEESTGIMKFAKSNESRPLLAVQANDERLFNSRDPLPHKHDYAPVRHRFNDHEGSLSISASRAEVFTEITPPPENAAVIHAINQSDGNGSIGIAGIAGILKEHNALSYGVIGHSQHVGIRGQSTGGDEKLGGCGVMGVSRFGAGGVFSSEHGFALIAEGSGKINGIDDSINLKGSGKAFFANGDSEFNGSITIKNQNAAESEFPLNMVELFEVDEEEYVSPGDILVISEAGNSVLSKSRKNYSTSVIGVVSGNPTVIINNSGKEKKIYPVALFGKALCRVDARITRIMPGDLIVSSDLPGCGMSGNIDSFHKIGSVIGKALDGLDEGMGLIPIFISHR
ncbi:MAG: discoidin domain-containing protein [Spirochaetes bacterium]|nr:discoidin domain-containing protein [Spirochaetota bacterium]